MWWLQSYYQPSLGCQSIPSSKTRGCFCNSKWWKQVLEIGSLASLPATLDKQSTMYVTINTHNGLYVPLQMTTFWSCFRSSTFFVCHHQYSQGLVPLQTATFWSCFCAGTFSKTDWHGPAGDSAHLHIICYIDILVMGMNTSALLQQCCSGCNCMISEWSEQNANFSNHRQNTWDAW